MGISRWTQDLTPYLEAGAITTTSDGESRLIIRNIVIDGPSLVYHAYNALALSGHAIAAGSLSEPTYLQLNSTVDVFLTDLESCGAKIERIFFDGALPHSKRNTRLERLEKSRSQLERLKVLGPPPRPLNLPGGVDRDQLSTLLWQTRSGSSGSSSFVGPFIVPSVIEYLVRSRWKDILSVVNGEAETSCAFIAKATGATVLSNDSDLTLLADMQDGQSVGLLRSMGMQRSTSKAPPFLTIQCWRPKHIATRLGVQSLLRVGFERSKDHAISFATVLQRSQDEKNSQNMALTELDKFADQFRTGANPDAIKNTGYGLNLNQLDPRIAELVCQLAEVNLSSAAAQNNELWVTLPILLEDPGKDSSWSYGRETRRLAYSLLCCSRGTATNYPQAITESSRKGPRIAQDIIQMIHPTKLSETIRKSVAELDSLHQSNVFPGSPGTNVPREYILWALGSVLKQRVAAGKNATASTTIQEYIGLDRRSPMAGKKARVPDHEGEWQLVHLNANVHSTLYSLRILHQVCGVLDSNFINMDCKDEFTRLRKCLKSMPTIQDLFLDTDRVKFLMRQSPLSRSDQAFADIQPYTGHSLRVSPPPKVDTTIDFMVATSKNASKRNKKRRLAENDADKQHKADVPRKTSTNPFDLLIGRT